MIYLIAGYFLFSFHVFPSIPSTIHSLLLSLQPYGIRDFAFSISWKVWKCFNFSVNWNQFLICWKCQIFCCNITKIADFKKSSATRKATGFKSLRVICQMDFFDKTCKKILRQKKWAWPSNLRYFTKFYRLGIKNQLKLTILNF